MARKRASLRDKGEEILGVKRGGKGADILFGTGSEPESTAGPETDETPAVVPSAGEDLPQGEADLGAGVDLDAVLSAEAEAAEGETILPAPAEYPALEESLPQGEADIDEDDLGNMLSAEAEAAEGEVVLPELATTPAAAAPPPPEQIAPTSPPPAVERPRPAPPPPMPAPSTVVERPVPAPLPPRPETIPPPPVESPPPPSTPTLAVAPPSTATGAPDLSVQRPPRYIQMIAGDFDLLAREPSADAAAAALIGAPEGVPLTEEQKAELLRRRSVQDDLAELDRAIDGQYERILTTNISVNEDITDWCHNLLAEARTIVFHRQVDRLARAEWNVEQVRARLDRADESRKQANRFAWPIILWGMAWFGIFVYLVFNPVSILRLLPIAESSESFLIPEVFLRALFFGGIGGVAAVFYYLLKYVQERSFDSQYALSYVAKPFMGMILGSMIYLTVFVVMRVLGLAPIGAQREGAQTVTDVMYMALLFFVAMAAGFRENVAFDLLSRVIKAVLGGDQQEETSTSASATSASGA